MQNLCMESTQPWLQSGHQALTGGSQELGHQLAEQDAASEKGLGKGKATGVKAWASV